ncbi:class I SAM-dependent methyltransferase [Pyrinomonas methylaliphatogenes]|uniref:2-polyprenyl-3-methyl-5-hydroxy-6-metoxy-1, 4-benzoquinol methylase n=1 Tax=Pyrinomonas methylaliphatogenes TaxID=454194 RepID=A0A0B6WVR8_9BACT|nr:class I SAM-dependent methyltransferase [Pyrinomonas methylaliphatogenes]CDM65181.1 2-polyprenyl-3-methyl-5-hydroxy-6-metoxy-1, 4-benzoquinol methylase [Pyrinomonas methylaliphatogenes]
MKEMDRQQEETLAYFRRAAGEWRRRAEGSVPRKVNVIKQRNDYVLRVAQERARTACALDVGCGTGELVCELARRGIEAVGVDFAAEMIALGRRKAEDEGIANARFVHASIFEYDPESNRFDLVSANGFIEYISPAELGEFIRRARALLAAGGSLVMGSRNRLFNAFSLNEYTKMEIDRGAYERLVAESLIWADASSFEEARDSLLARDGKLPSIDRHPLTGIGVHTRHQYTPGELIRRLTRAGFEPVGIRAVHYHAAPPRFAREHPDAHVQFAETMNAYAPACLCLIPFSSSFMIHAVRS